MVCLESIMKTENLARRIFLAASDVRSATASEMERPKLLVYARVAMLFEITRLAGLQFLVAPGGLPAYFASPFGAGDFLTGLTAAIAAWALGRPGSRRYALVLAWNSLGLVDALFGLAVSSYGGILGQISAMLGNGLYLLPIDIVVHAFAISVLLTGRVSRYMTK
jgi:hypothetical protein